MSEDKTSARPTMRMIADLAGVNISTVSRVLRQPSTDSDSETARRIRHLADKLGYRRDLWAASLRSRRTNALGIVVTRLTDIVMASVYEAIEQHAQARGYLAIAGSSQDDPNQQRSRIEHYIDRKLDGLLIGDAHLHAPFLDELAEREVRFVLFNRSSGEHPSVTWDDELGGAIVAQHFLDLGHERMAIINGLNYSSSGVMRAKGFLAALSKEGVNLPSEMVINAGFDAAAGREAAKELLRLRPRPTAIFAVNDYSAIGAMGVIRDEGLEVGKDIAVVGYNDISIADDLLVPLSSVRVPIDIMGRTAVEMIISQMNGEPVTSRRLTPYLVVRDSSRGRPGKPT
ncbi:LacI family DNA-binding transcriptional regulator [Sneathiella litorea]|uniref:Substrate-binding domain-containing protein n=1 Tax=Sneathiella litorea TaxID=2606216 RepID=A0A6L8WAI0_9PROT|nr:substrate-binding domain-containing protein [Sneathiella litorea]MZR31502.1 substrate-binding domain-containing protein [Sneathiella litorea]